MWNQKWIISDDLVMNENMKYIQYNQIPRLNFVKKLGIDGHFTVIYKGILRK